MSDLPLSPFDDHYGLGLDEATDELVRGYWSRGRLLLKPAFGRRVARVKWQVSGIVRCFAHASRLR